MRRMTKRFGAFALVFLASAFSFATVTVSGTLVNPATGLVSSRAKVRFVIHCNGSQPVVTGTGVIIPGFTELTPDGSGAISGTVYSSATEISCGQGNAAGTGWYGVIPYYDGKPGPEVSYTISGASWNYNSATPNTVAPTVTAPTGDSTYVRLDGGNNPTGTISPSTNGTLALGGTSARWDLFANAIDSDSFVKLRASTAPTCLASIGFIWYETSTNLFKACENNGSAFKLHFLPADYGDATWGPGSSFTWTFSEGSSTTNPSIVFNKSLTIVAGAGAGAGGAITATAGAGAASSSGGAVTITAGTGGSTSGAGGAMTLKSGPDNATGSGGSGTFTAGTGNGASTNSAAGGATIVGGNGSGTGAGGNVTLQGGTGGNTSGVGGTVTINAGNGGGSGNGGNITLNPGNKTSGTVGAIIISGYTSSPAVSSADSASVEYDNLADKIKISENGGAYSSITSIPCATSQKSESAADTNVLTCTPSAAVGTYRISFSMGVSAQNTATLGWTATWKDANGSAQAPTNLSMFAIGTAAPANTILATTNGNYHGTAIIDVDNSATAIVVKLTFAGTSFTAKASASIERIQ